MTRLPPAWVVRPLLAVRNAVGRLHDGMVPPQVSVLEGTFGIITTKALAVVCELGIADLVDRSPASAAALADDTGANADSLERVLRFLVAKGFFRRGRDGRYRNNRRSALLQSDGDESIREWVRFYGSPWHVDIWNHLDHSTRTGESAAVQAFGRPFWEHLSEADPAAGALFDAAMEDVSRVQTELVPKRHDFSKCARVCDVGGGTGTLLAGILAPNPGVRGVLFDLPSVVAKAKPVLEAADVADRVEAVGGSFLDSVPDGCDRYVLQAIVHDWDDESNVRILGNIRAAMAPDARVLVLEQELPRHDGWHLVKAVDLEMLVDTGAGRERTRQEFEALFARAGLRLAKTQTLPVMTIFELVAA